MTTSLSSNDPINSSARKPIIAQHLGELDDRPQGFAYVTCPGAALHTSRTGKKDCRVHYQSGPPTLFCLHSSCVGIVEAMNFKLRSTLGKLEAGANIVPAKFEKSPEQIVREHEQRETERLAKVAREQLPKILASYPWPAEQIYSDSPEGVSDDPAHDWRLILSLFRPDETLWCGDTRDSGSLRHASYFRTAAKWLSTGVCPKGPFILPAALQPMVWNRTAANIVRLPFLVVESDTLAKDEIGALFRWLNQVVGLPLVAVVDTGGRSLHGWFARPDAATLRDLRAVLPAMQCDGAVLRDTQPVRLPGCQRPGTDRRQNLLYLNREAAQ